MPQRLPPLKAIEAFVAVARPAVQRGKAVPPPDAEAKARRVDAARKIRV